MRTTVGSLDVVAPCESRNVTSLEGIDLLLDFLDSLFSVPSAQNLCGDSRNKVINVQFAQWYATRNAMSLSLAIAQEHKI